MKKEFRGIFGKSAWSIFVPTNLLGFISRDRLTITNEKLIVVYGNKTVELEKSQIKKISNVYFWQSIWIDHSNLDLPNRIIFYPLFSWGPLSTSTVARELKKFGYLVE